MMMMIRMTIFINTQQSYPLVASPSRCSIDGGVGGCNDYDDDDDDNEFDGDDDADIDEMYRPSLSRAAAARVCVV